MPETTVVTWVCSRCGAIERFDSTAEQPQNWGRVEFMSPPRAARERGLNMGDLCNPCGGLLVDFVNGRNLPEEMAKALEISRIETWAEENVGLATELRDTQETLRRLRATLREALGLTPEDAPTT